MEKRTRHGGWKTGLASPVGVLPVRSRHSATSSTCREAVRLGDVAQADEPGWEAAPDDEWGVAVITTVGRQLKPRREAAGMRAAEFAAAVK
jgi:hypothetical protein